jgi:hypothetical protein
LSSDNLDVSPEFIEESKKIINNLVRPRQKFAPYTRAQRRKRRNEVYRLHFEKGLPAIKIADLMKVNRNTINEDIRQLYKELAKDVDSIEFSDQYIKQVTRLELQRTRLTEYLEKTPEIEKKIAIEKLLSDIDFRLMAMAEKIEHNSVIFWDKVKKMFNEIAEKKNIDYRTTTILELVEISTKSRMKLDDLIKEIRPE